MGSIKDLEDALRNFVDNHEGLYAVYTGSPVEIENPEDEDVLCYYLLSNDSFSFERSDELGEILLKHNPRNIFVQEWPVYPEEINTHPHLERCIYKKTG